jgi:hypothetical protein
MSQKKIEIRDEREALQRGTLADSIMEFLADHGVDSVEKLKGIFEPSAYAVIPVSILEDRNITPNAKLLYAELLALARKNGSCFATNKHMASRLGVSERTVQNCLVELQGLDLVEVSIDKNQTGTWRSIKVVWQKGGTQNLRGGMKKLRAGDESGCVPGTKQASPQKRISRKRESKKDIAAASAATPSEPKPECKRDGCGSKPMKDREFCEMHQAMNLHQFVEWCKKGEAKHIHIIGEWADTLKPSLETVAQWQEFIARHVRTAKRLVPFSQEQLERGWAQIEKNRAEGWLTEFTLETLLKYVTNSKTI